MVTTGSSSSQQTDFSPDNGDQGPGHAFLPFLVMEDLLDKLKLLNYDIQFVADLKMRPLNRHYFVLQTNPGEQFFVFSSLCAWLVRRAGQQFEQPQEQEDPNTVISNILHHVRNSGVVIDFPPSKLKQGYGEHAIFILDRLADLALRKSNWAWRRPVPPTTGGAEEPEEVDDDDEIILERLEEEMAEDYSEEDEADIPHIDQLTPPVSERAGFGPTARPGNIMMESRVNVDSWRLEVERVAPSLKVSLRSESRDWRAHLDQIHHHRNKMELCLGSAVTDLGNSETQLAGLNYHCDREITERAGGHLGPGSQQGETHQPPAGATAQQLQVSLSGRPPPLAGESYHVEVAGFGPGQGAAEAGELRDG